MSNKRKKDLLCWWFGKVGQQLLYDRLKGCPQFKPHLDYKYMDFWIRWKRNIFTTFVCVHCTYLKKGHCGQSKLYNKHFGTSQSHVSTPQRSDVGSGVCEWPRWCQHWQTLSSHRVVSACAASHCMCCISRLFVNTQFCRLETSSIWQLQGLLAEAPWGDPFQTWKFRTFRKTWPIGACADAKQTCHLGWMR